ncbi:MAG TPA: phosphoribosylanthranilate isomerase [Pyrinomonadaceae bacterium]|nr:phosphoribosylanthranilate isomerase [Pyrinomonadaceae bacterium]
MLPTSNPRVKICCIASRAEAWMAIKYGASALGLVSAMPSGPGPISEDLIAEIAADIPPPLGTFLLTSKQDAGAIIQQQKRTGVNTIQICDRVEVGTYAKLRADLPGISLVQVIHVTGPESIAEAVEIAPSVDAILLDSGNQALAIKELGGTGRTHDWTISVRIREAIEIPLFLAGGLNPMNVADAIHQVQPFGIDLCSGVRTNGALDETKLSAFFRAVRNANC